MYAKFLDAVDTVCLWCNRPDADEGGEDACAACWVHATVQKCVPEVSPMYAAAPDMYDALRDILAQIEAGEAYSCADVHDAMRAALCKADGGIRRY